MSRPHIQPSRRLRSVWGITPIINICHNAKAERLLGIDSETLVFSEYFITKDFTRNFSRWCRWRWLKFLVPMLVFPWALSRYDIFHFYFDRGILPSWGWQGIRAVELAVLKFFRKKVFVYTFGADVRTKARTESLGPYHCCMHCPAVGKACVCQEKKSEKILGRVRRDATGYFSMGDMTEYTPGSENGLFFWPIDVRQVPYIGVSASAVSHRPVRIVHSPNHRHYKGTDYLLKAVDRLKLEGLPVELVMVERVSNEEALKMYAGADIVAEQFIIGWHGFTAIEAMALGKPVICYIRKSEYLLHPEECPIVSADPDHLEQVLRDLIADAGKRKRLGAEGRRYVERYFSLEAFAGRLRRLYEKHGILKCREAEETVCV
ncbi:MAG: glycosyltransferase family 4 protein [Candidatus Omnitrophica bacterium]|nr:glycosyltransferase family 4 protein [Candidatus Omnitrophota bacterium]MDD5672070.1 glycosyltransferase family 4 protein [Candidatus Omnitrophota bacterium]